MTSLIWLGLGNLALAAPLAVAAWLAGRFLRRPAITHGLWVLVLLKLVTPPLGLVPVARIEATPAVAPPVAAVEQWAPSAVDVAARLPDQPVHFDFAPRREIVPERVEPPARAIAPVVAPVAAPVRPVAAVAPELPPAESWWTIAAAWAFPAVASVWILGAVVFWLRTARAAWRFERLLRQTPQAPAEIRGLVERLAGEWNVRAPRVAMAQSVLSPMLWVWGRTATLVLPRVLFERLAADQQAMLLVHELAHWKRGDHWVRRLECLAGGLYWWCPLAW